MLTFDDTNNGDDHIRSRINLGGDGDTVVDLLGSHHLFQYIHAQFDGEKPRKFIDEVKWRVVDEIPATKSEKSIVDFIQTLAITTPDIRYAKF